jgi:hypothetical protein
MGTILRVNYTHTHTNIKFSPNAPLFPYTYNQLNFFYMLIQVKLDVRYILYFFLDNVSSTCFGCYLHPSSGAQLQRIAIGLYGLVCYCIGAGHGVGPLSPCGR